MAALDALYQHASTHASPSFSLDIARLALTHRHRHSEQVVGVAKNIVSYFATHARESVDRPHPRLPPRVNADRLRPVVTQANKWNAPLPRDVLELAVHDAIMDGADGSHLKELIAAGADVNAVHDTLFFPPLTVAARSGNVDLVRVLVDAGADVDSCVGGHTALVHAAWFGHADVVAELERVHVRLGEDVNHFC